MKPEKFLKGAVTLHPGDCREVLKSLPDNSIDSVTTDPPYALVSIVKRLGKAGAAPAKGNAAYMRASAGFMGKQWDTGEVAFSEEFWAEVLRVLKPGGHVAAFGASRGYHRMACAIEDAGFEIRDSIINVIDPESPVVNFMASLNDEQLGAFMRCLDDAEFGGTLAWMYGSGFPKSQNVAKFIDREKGMSGRKVANGAPVKRMIPGADQNTDGWIKDDGREYVPHTYLPSSEEGQRFNGFGTALKPAFEPIVIARKPLSEGTVAANVLRWGTGALNIDGCRVPVDPEADAAQLRTMNRGQRVEDTSGQTWGMSKGGADAPQVVRAEGRWPANVVHDGSHEVVGAFPAEAGAFAPVRGTEPSNSVVNVYGARDRVATVHHGDSGSAARFFFSAKADADDRLGSGHPTVKPVDLMQWIVRLITPPGGTTLDPFAGTGTTGEAAWREGMKAVLVERDAEYQDCIRRRMRLALAGPDERRRESIKAKLERKGEEIDLGPLFGGT